MAFSATESNVIGVAANMGMYAMGIPAGLLVDKKGPKWGVLAGGIALACGYFPIHRAYINGPGSMSLQMISLCSFLEAFLMYFSHQPKGGRRRGRPTRFGHVETWISKL